METAGFWSHMGLHVCALDSHLPLPTLQSQTLRRQRRRPLAVDTSSDSPVTAADELVREAHELMETGIAPEGVAESFPARLEEELRRLTEAEAAAAAALATARDQHLRLAADYENFRKRSAAEKDSLRSATQADTVEALLGVVDSFEQARASLLRDADEAARRVVEAYDAVHRQLLASFKRLGVEAVPGEGEPFDPEVHEAIMREPAAEGVPDGTVVQEFRKGFRLGSRLLRPGMVKVAFVEDA